MPFCIELFLDLISWLGLVQRGGLLNSKCGLFPVTT